MIRLYSRVSYLGNCGVVVFSSEKRVWEIIQEMDFIAIECWGGGLASAYTEQVCSFCAVVISKLMMVFLGGNFGKGRRLHILLLNKHAKCCGGVWGGLVFVRVLFKGKTRVLDRVRVEWTEVELRLKIGWFYIFIKYSKIIHLNRVFRIYVFG